MASSMMEEIKQIWKEIIALLAIFGLVSSKLEWWHEYALFLEEIKYLADENPILWGIKAFQPLLISIIGFLILSVLISFAKKWIKEKLSSLMNS